MILIIINSIFYKIIYFKNFKLFIVKCFSSKTRLAIYSIENYFSMIKSRLQKLEGLKYKNLKNIEMVLNDIPKKNIKIYLGVLIKDQKNI